MKKFIFLYIGPFAADLNLPNPPLTQAALDAWIQSIGDALVDRGTLFGAGGKGVLDHMSVEDAPIPMHGYSIVQSEDIAGAVELTRGHPFLDNGKQGYFEIEILELISGDVPANATVATYATPPTVPEAASPSDTSLFTVPEATVAPQQPGAAPAPHAPYPDIPPPQPSQPQSQVFAPQQTPGELSISHDEPPQDNQTLGGPQPPTLPPPQH